MDIATVNNQFANSSPQDIIRHALSLPGKAVVFVRAILLHRTLAAPVPFVFAFLSY